MIPNRWHFIFGLREQAEPFSLLHYLCLRSCLTVNQPKEVVLHLHHEPWGPWWDRIRPELILKPISRDVTLPNVVPAEKAIERFRYAHQADFLRLEILRDEGGIYADMDTLFLRPLPANWFECACIMGEEQSPRAHEGIGSLCNAWIAAEPGALFITRWLDAMPAHFDGTWSNHSTILPWQLAQADPSLIRIMPESRFFALPWTRQGIRGLFETDVPLPEAARSLHLWHHLWAGQRDRSFTHFHAALVTPEYVAFAPTTYAKAARRFLPTDLQPRRLRYRWQQLMFLQNRIKV